MKNKTERIHGIPGCVTTEASATIKRQNPRTGRTNHLQPAVGHEVEVPLHRVADAGLDDSAGEEVAGLILVFPENSRKQTNQNETYNSASIVTTKSRGEGGG